MRKFLRFLMWGAIGLIALVILFYGEEDWRGAHAWAKAKAEIEAQGESLDPNKFISPPVPDAQNFGALPLFKLSPNPKFGSPYLYPVALRQALDRVENTDSGLSREQAKYPDSFPYLGKWQEGEQPDLPAIQARLTQLCRKKLPSIQIAPDVKSTQLYELLCPALGDLRAANASHPLCRFEREGDPEISWMIAGSLLSGLQDMEKSLCYQECLALIDNQPDLAFADMKVGWKVSGLLEEPGASGALSFRIARDQIIVINEGFARHAWNDQQLIELDTDLGKMDLLSQSLFGTSENFTLAIIPALDHFKADRSWLWRPSPGMSDPPWQYRSFWHMVPNGWVDQYKVTYTRYYLFETIRMVDAASHRVFPEKEVTPPYRNQDTGPGPFDMWPQELSWSLLHLHGSIMQIAYAQVQIDQALIASRLERYRLAHGDYPASLDELVPAYGSNLPHDIMNGEPYHYKLMGDGKYRLYSVGWNQKDDHGETGHYRNLQSPDWVWANYPDMEATK